MEAVTQHSSEQAVPLIYQGRKTSRAGSEQRRRSILEAALRIVVRDGVRGVRHRAVAREAEVPLSATTYYFKDINDLITDTFTLFVEQGAEHYYFPWQEVFTQPTGDSSQIQARLAMLVMDYLHRQLQDNRQYLLAEQAFRLECLRNPNLQPMSGCHTSRLQSDLQELCVHLGSQAPKLDSEVIAQVILTAEYESLLKNQLDETAIRSFVTRSLQHLLTGIERPPLTQ